MFERLTTKARTVVNAQAQEVARKLGNDHVSTEHLLLALLTADPDHQGTAAAVLAELGITTAALEHQLTAMKRRHPGRLDAADADALAAIGIDLEAIRRKAEETFGPGALERATRQRRGRLPLTEQAKQALQQSLREVAALGARHIGTEHLLLGLLGQPDDPAVAALRALNAPPEAVRARVLKQLHRAP